MFFFVSRVFRKVCVEVVPVGVRSRGSEAEKLFNRIVSREVSGFFSSCEFNKLSRFISENVFSVREEVQILECLNDVCVRHEEVMTSCLWNIFKAGCQSVLMQVAGRSEEGLSASQLADYTAVAFRIMTEQRLVQDLQLISVGIGRCVELAPNLSFHGLSEVYRGIFGLQVQHFTISEVILREGRGTMKAGEPLYGDTLRAESREVDMPSTSDLIHQPNLIDVLCLCLERRLREFLEAGTSEKRDRRDVCESFEKHGSSSECEDKLLKVEYLHESKRTSHLFESQDVLFVVKGLSFLGVQNEKSLVYVEELCKRSYNPTISFYSSVLFYGIGINLRPMDALTYVEESSAFLEYRNSFRKALCSMIVSKKNIQSLLRRDLLSVLRLRKLFEACPELSDEGSALWDILRMIPVSHKKAIALSPYVADIEDTFKNQSLSCHHKGDVIRRGRLFTPQYSVKLKKVTKDCNEAEKFIPPQFKTWTSPLNERGKRQGPNGERVRFGIRRVTKNYIREKRKKFCPSVRGGSNR